MKNSFILIRDKASEDFGYGEDQYSLNALISEDSLPLLSDSKCEEKSEEKLSCVSPNIKGILISYATSPATVLDFEAPIQFECKQKGITFLKTRVINNTNSNFSSYRSGGTRYTGYTAAYPDFGSPEL